MPKSPERYTEEEAVEEASKMQKKIEQKKAWRSSDAKKYSHAETLAELEQKIESAEQAEEMSEKLSRLMLEKCGDDPKDFDSYFYVANKLDDQELLQKTIEAGEKNSRIFCTRSKGNRKI